MRGPLSWVLVGLGALSFVGGAYGQTNTPTPTRAFTPTFTPTSNRPADLALSMVASPLPAQVGQELTYTLTVRNNGPSHVLDVNVEDTLPAGVTFVSSSPQFACSGTFCRFGPLFAGGTLQVVIVVRPTNAGSVTNSARVSSQSGMDPNFSNNTASVTTDVREMSAFLRGSGAGAGRVLSLDSIAPTAAVAKFQDSAALRSGLANPWVEVGTWAAPPALFAGTLGKLEDLHVWLGLKNGDDEGTRFDLRAELWKNIDVELVASGEAACLQGVTRNPDRAREATVPFDLFPPVSFDGTTDVMSLKVSTRIATTCSGHGSAIGLRLYFDSIARPSGFGTAHSMDQVWQLSSGRSMTVR